MPEFTLSVGEPFSKRLSEVHPYEVWEDTDGDAVWFDGDKVVYASKATGRINAYNGCAEDITVTRKLSDPIVISW